MKFIFTDLVEYAVQQGAQMCPKLLDVFNANLAVLEDSLIQDLSHISDAAKYNGGLKIDSIAFLKENV